MDCLTLLKRISNETLKCTFLSICLVVAIDSSSAQVISVNDAQSFAHDYVRILKSKNIDSIRALTHPKSLICWRDSNLTQGLNTILELHESHAITSGYTVSVTPIPADQSLLMDEIMSFPVRPSHMIQIDFEEKNYSGISLGVYVVRQGDRWYQVLPCPKPEMIPQLDSLKRVRNEQEERVKKVFAGLRNPLRSEVRALVLEGKKVEAVLRLKLETGEELWVARRVVELLVADK